MIRGGIWQAMRCCVRLPVGYVRRWALMILSDAMAVKSLSSCCQAWAYIQLTKRQNTCVQSSLHAPVLGGLVLPPLLSLSLPPSVLVLRSIRCMACRAKHGLQRLTVRCTGQKLLAVTVSLLQG